jgi:hypothetical protein
MNRYLLPLVVNNRRAIVLPLDTHPNSPTAYIVESDLHAGKVPILTISKDKVLQTLIPHTNDVALQLLDFFFEYENNQLLIKLQQRVANNTAKKEDDWRTASRVPGKSPITTSPQIQFTFTTGIDILINEIENDIWVYANYSEGACKQLINNNLLKIEFEFQEKYKGLMHIALSNPESILALGFDFGSESSQIRHKRFKKIGEDLFENYEDPNVFQILANYKKEYETPAAYYQSEKDTPFLKSIFFVEKELDSQIGLIEDESFLPNPNNLATIKKTQLADAVFFRTWLQLPNLKLSHKYGNDLQSFQLSINNGISKRICTLDQIKGQLYSTVLKDILEAYLCAYVNTNKPHDLRIHLLVPNIYDYQDLARTKDAIKKIINNLNKTVLQNAIRHYELVTLSESDASYMGFFNTGKRIAQPNHYYVIIDCGKGTTDFSVVQTEQHAASFRNIYRDGFAGAGNLLTYACFEAFSYYLIKVSSNKTIAKQYLNNLFNNLQGGQKELFYQEIERYKRNYNSQLSQLQIEQDLNNIKSGNIGFENLFEDANVAFETLLSLMQQIQFIFDWNNYISSAIQFINTQINNGLTDILSTLQTKGVPCGGVLLSGRGFLFESLKTATIATLEQMGLPQVIINTPETAKAYKSVCMQGVFKHNYIFNSDIMCMPVELLPQQKTANIPDASASAHLKGLFKGKLNIVNYFFKHDFKFNERANSMQVHAQDLNSARFIIGNTFYQVKNTSIANHGYLLLQFDNNRFVLRSLDKNGMLLDTSPLVMDTVNTYNFSSHIFASLFPVVLQPDQMDFLNQNYLDTHSFLPNI